MKFLGADLVMIQIAGVFWANGWSDFLFLYFRCNLQVRPLDRL